MLETLFTSLPPFMRQADLLTTYGLLTGIIWLRYFIVAGLFYFLLWGRPAERVRARRLSPRAPQGDVVRHEVKMSLVSSMIYAVPGAIVMEAFKAGHTAIYTGTPSALGFMLIPLSILTYLFIHDTYFYWTHRLMHLPALFKATHLTHHRSRQPSPWAAFSFHPWEAILSAWLLPVCAFFIPIHAGAVFFLLIFMTLCSVINHAGWEILPRMVTDGSVGRLLISASHHNVHHRDYNANYGLYFRFWDRLMGTDKGLADPVSPSGATLAKV
ncbi:MAG: sterol desaturase family protein [Pseudomonadota bacterium]